MNDPATSLTNTRLPQQSWGSLLLPVTLLLAIVSITSISFFKTSSFALLNFDDPLHLTANPFIQPDSPGRYVHFWREPYGKLYVPITYNLWGMVYARCFDLQTGAFDPSLLHKLNVLTHAINSGLVFLLLRRISCGRSVRVDLASALGAAFFALHPLQVESVAWISEFRGLLAACFGLLAWLIHLHAADARGRITRLTLEFTATGAFAAALLSKPSAAALPLMVAVADVMLLRVALRTVALRLAFWFVLALVCLAAMRTLQSSGTNYAGLLWTRPLVAIDSLVFYLGKLFWPIDLCADYSRTTRQTLGTSTIRWLWIIPAAMVALLIWKPNRVALAASALFALALFPVLGLIPFEFQRLSTVADRYAYLALLGPALLLTWVVSLRKSFVPFAVLLIGVLGWRSQHQLDSWKDDRSLWTNAANVNPRAVVANANLAVAAGEAGDIARATSLFQKVIALDPERSNGYIGIGSLLLNRGNAAEALEWFGRAARAEPHLAEPRLYAGEASLALGRREEAIEQFEVALSLEPGSVEAMSNLAAILVDAGKLDEAALLIDRALTLHPRHVGAWMQRAALLEKRKDTRGYIDAMNTAARFAGNDTTPIDALGRFAMKIEDWKAAVECFERSLRIAPDRVPILVELGTALAQSGQLDRAADVLNAARRLAPGSEVIENNLRSVQILKERRQSTPTAGQKQ